jgi:hypothetical protein
VSKNTRELPEMVAALERQVRLLRTYVCKAQTDPDYWSEVASKLRLLIVERPLNKALLLHVASAYKALSLEVRPDDGSRSWEQLLDAPLLRTGDHAIEVPRFPTVSGLSPV